MAEEWYYAQDGVTRGPVSTAELRALAGRGELLPDDFIWKDGMGDWVPASRTKGLFPDGAGGTSGSLSEPAAPVGRTEAAAAAPPAEEEELAPIPTGGAPGFAGARPSAGARRARPPGPAPRRRGSRVARAAEPEQRPWTYWVAVAGAGLVFLAILVIVWPTKRAIGPGPDDVPHDPTVPRPSYIVGSWDSVLTAVNGETKKLFIRYLEDSRFDMYVYPPDGGQPKRLRWGTWKMEGDQLVLSASNAAEGRSLPRIVDRDTMRLTAGEGTYLCRRTAAPGASPGGGAAPAPEEPKEEEPRREE